MAEHEKDIGRATHESAMRWAAYLGGAAALVVVWGLYLLRVAFDIDVLGARRGRTSTNPALLLWLALAATALVPLLVWWQVRKLRRLRARGLEAEGRIMSVGASKLGLKTVVVRFTVDGVEYTTKKDILEDHPEDQPVRVIYDPADPRKCDVMA